MSFTDAREHLIEIVGYVEGSLEVSPDMTGQDVLALLRTLRDRMTMVSEPTAKCRHCGQGIWDLAGKWRHCDPDNSIGCRAASYREGKGWDDTLDRHWTAKPAKLTAPRSRGGGPERQDPQEWSPPSRG
ncbi:MAG TPA: hypothetical protein VK735_18585 [Pseudonocardia sp.]|uniref:hypothetical protein n=1 Tax=Pseudonocardia sp. TaxID=60912 RepID=UPI002CDF88DB|nr:hypothetical protein [Pseudonocardia sp.]HTF49454.1 hypothetical protein [Pseudonocardia sp.]